MYVSREFQDFLTKWFMTWKPSSPYFAQSNVLAESSVIFEIFIVETRCSEYEVVGIQDCIVWVSLHTDDRRTKPEHFRVWSSVAIMFGYTPYGVQIILDQGYGARRCLESRQKRPKSTTTLLLLISRLFHWDRWNWPKREYKILFPSGYTVLVAKSSSYSSFARNRRGGGGDGDEKIRRRWGRRRKEMSRTTA